MFCLMGVWNMNFLFFSRIYWQFNWNCRFYTDAQAQTHTRVHSRARARTHTNAQVFRSVYVPSACFKVNRTAVPCGQRCSLSWEDARPCNRHGTTEDAIGGKYALPCCLWADWGPIYLALKICANLKSPNFTWLCVLGPRARWSLGVFILRHHNLSSAGPQIFGARSLLSLVLHNQQCRKFWWIYFPAEL